MTTLTIDPAMISEARTLDFNIFGDMATDIAKMRNPAKRHNALVALEAHMMRAGFTRSDMQQVADFYKDCREAARMLGY